MPDDLRSFQNYRILKNIQIQRFIRKRGLKFTVNFLLKECTSSTVKVPVRCGIYVNQFSKKCAFLDITPPLKTKLVLFFSVIADPD